MTSILVECRVCGKQPMFHPLWQVRGFDWAQCEACGSLLVVNVPTATYFETHYNDDYYAGDAERFQVGSYVDYIGHRPFIQANLARRVNWMIQNITTPTIMALITPTLDRVLLAKN
jgi:hypothetical protein